MSLSELFKNKFFMPVNKSMEGICIRGHKAVVNRRPVMNPKENQP